jgi:predicted nucleotidyltransferase
MTFGFSENEFELLLRLVIAPLKTQGLKVFIFGSRATGKHHKFSDVDILWENPHNLELPKAFISNIKEEIEESRFPVKVDLVASLDLAESYRDTVNRQKVAV